MLYERAVKFGLIGAILNIILAYSLSNYHYNIYFAGLDGFFLLYFFSLFEVLFSKKHVSRLPFIYIFLIRIVLYSILIVLIVMMNVLLYLFVFEGHSLQNATHGLYNLHVKNLEPSFSLYLFGAIIYSYVNQLQSLISENVFINYLLGKYHRPRLESRAFMFLDLSSATTIGEMLGPQKYSTFLKEFFRELDDIIYERMGLIHQYVGDEVVIIWKLKDAFTNNNCIELYFDAVKYFEQVSEKFKKKYGITPSFKAGVHCGEITITEVGVRKKEIAYHGDTINSTARLCSICHQLGVSFIFSQAVLNQSTINNDRIQDLGIQYLKGKEQAMQLYTIKS